MERPPPADESRVLVIYTGGTIGMLVGQHGYVPEPYFLTETLRSQTRFHDPQQDSLFSNSASVQGFRDWSSGSGRTTPSPESSSTTFATAIPLLTLLVRSTRPIGNGGTLSAFPKNPSTLEDANKSHLCSDGVYEANLPCLVTPRSNVPGSSGSKRIRYAILEWNPLLDSSNIEAEDWIRIATEIELNYSFDAFVILHGTDTMSYTSSALSFLLEDLGKTVIITGSQVPMCQLRNDAVDNLMGSLLIAGQYIIPECCLYFNHTLYRGNRVAKVSSYDLSAFHSPNFSPLVNVGIDIVVNWNDVIRQTNLKRFKAHKQMNPHVATLRLFPGISAVTIRAFLTPPIRGVVLETYGAGNAPQRADLTQALKDACDRGVIIVAITQCLKGTVSDAYETGRNLLKAGVIPGGDMTPECALTKLSYLLSKPELSTAEVRDLIGTPIRGELTRMNTSPLSQQQTVNQELGNMGVLLSQFVRLSRQSSKSPSIVISPDPLDATQKDSEAAAPWSWTAAEAAATEASLLPFIIHLAAARNDPDGIKFCIASAEKEAFINSTPGNHPIGVIVGGIVNCLEPASGRSPLHVAALNGCTDSVHLLLKSGALVHLRDSLGHTALYYAARQAHADIVDVLVQAGARLGEFEASFATLAVNSAARADDQNTLQIWAKTGIKVGMV